MGKDHIQVTVATEYQMKDDTNKIIVPQEFMTYKKIIYRWKKLGKEIIYPSLETVSEEQYDSIDDIVNITAQEVINMFGVQNARAFGGSMIFPGSVIFYRFGNKPNLLSIFNRMRRFLIRSKRIKLQEIDMRFELDGLACYLKITFHGAIRFLCCGRVKYRRFIFDPGHGNVKLVQVRRCDHIPAFGSEKAIWWTRMRMNVHRNVDASLFSIVSIERKVLRAINMVVTNIINVLDARLVSCLLWPVAILILLKVCENELKTK